jgi:phosphodiesterase/alkaline phosphatase D-like protein
MAVALAGTGTGYVTTATGTSGNLSVAKPANLADQNLMVAVCYARNRPATGTATFTPPTGWTEAVSNSGNASFAVYTKYVAVAADEVASSYTFTSLNGGRWLGSIFLVTGVDSATPVDVAAASTSFSANAGLTVPTLTPTGNDGLLVSVVQGHQTSASFTFTPHSGMTEVADWNVTSGTSFSAAEIAVEQLSSSSSGVATGTRTAVPSSAASNSSGMSIVLKAGIFTPPPATLVSLILGALKPDRFRAVAHALSATTGRIAVSTSSSMSSPTYGASATPDSRGRLQLSSPTTLTPDTEYYWGVELNSALHTEMIGRVRTAPATSAPASFSFAAASCARTNSNQPVFSAIRSRVGASGKRAAFFAHLGDMHYADLADNGTATLDANYTMYENVLSQANQAQLYRETPLVYMPSDHDWGGSNADKDCVNGPHFQSLYRAAFPHYDLVPDSNSDGAGIYHSFGVGRILFIVTDGRSYMTSPLATDGPTKTKLGATQKAWLKTELARSDYPIKIWFHEDGWNNAATWTPSLPENRYADDTWSGYNTERTEIGNHIVDSSAKVWYVHGDFHALAADNGSNNLWGGFPIASCSPLDQTTFIGNGGWSEGFYPNPINETAYSQMYGWFDVIDNGDAITIAYTGYDQDGGSHITLAKTYLLGSTTQFSGWGIPM